MKLFFNNNVYTFKDNYPAPFWGNPNSSWGNSYYYKAFLLFELILTLLSLEVTTTGKDAVTSEYYANTPYSNSLHFNTRNVWMWGNTEKCYSDVCLLTSIVCGWDIQLVLNVLYRTRRQTRSKLVRVTLLQSDVVYQVV